MGKKLLWIVCVAAILLFAVWLFYRHLTRNTPPPPPPVASNWPASIPSPPATPATPPSPRLSPTEPASKSEPTSGEPGFVLRQGETLDYDANVTKLDSTVAHIRISAVEERTSAGRGVWHLQALAHTENPYRMVFELDDQFDSYSNAGPMTSVQYEMHLSERGQKVDTVERMLTSMQDPLPNGGSGVRVPAGTRDPLSLLAYLRGIDWTRTSEVRSPAYDGRKLYDVRAVFMGKANAVPVPAGKFDTIKIEIHVFDNGQEMKNAHFLLHLTNDANRVPVLMEAVLPVATARVELTKSVSGQ